jgi:glyoxylase-like metal-dependent hydrolase (beta-lactamase superfamily II)
MHGEEWDYWRFEHESGREAYGVIADSVVPIVEAGQAMLVDGTHAIDEHLTFESTPGHTPGHVCVRLRTGGGEAVFSGDVMHRTVQVAEPQWSSRFCADPDAAARTRRQFVERHADTGVLVLPAHFPAPGFIVRERGGFRFQAAPASAA